MRIAMISPVAWRTPPRHYGPWEQVVSLLTEGLVRRGLEVTLFATADSVTAARLHAVCPTGYAEDESLNAKVWECLHVAEVFEHAHEFDLIHNQYDYLPLTYSALVKTPVVTTIHEFSAPTVLAVYRKYNGRCPYVSISDADRHKDLDYVATVYHGIDIARFTYRADPEDYLLFFGRIRREKGAREAIEIARRADRKLVIAGIIHDAAYYRSEVEPHVDGDRVAYVGSVGAEARDRLLGGAAALLHPIQFEEPFGLSVVEAMACGTPVIAFARGSMPEIIQHGENGFLVNSIEEAVVAVDYLGDVQRERCRRMVEERFTADRMVDDYVAVYEQVLGRTAAGRA